MKEAYDNCRRWREFTKAMQMRFSMIDVAKAQQKAKAKDSKGSLVIMNEIRLITVPEHVFSLWSKVISSAAHGELIDADTLKKFNVRMSWKTENGMLNKEFFKFFGNLTNNNLVTLANHILNWTGKKRRHPHPKVIVRQVSSVLESCYTSKEWIERRKCKSFVTKELNKLDPTLGLLNVVGEPVASKWKDFKKNYNVTSATMNVLLERPGEKFFSEVRQLKSKNKTLE